MKIIVALDSKNGIGKDNSIPWLLKSDLKHFKNVTTHSNNPLKLNVVIMGRKTWEGLPIKPLKNRVNIVLSRTSCNFDGAINATSLTNALDHLRTIENVNMDNIFVIGGEALYEETIKMDVCEKIYVTEVYGKYDCDVNFPKIPEYYEITSVSKFKEENGIHFRNLVYTNRNYFKEKFNEKYIWKNFEEENYISVLDELLKIGNETVDRTGVGTYSLFGKMFKYNLSDTFPLLTTRRQFMRGIFEEFMFYLSGKTDNKILQEKKVHVWDGNTSREFLDKSNLSHYPEGDLGETYGFNFRHYGAEYKTCNENYENQGFDQLTNVIELIKNNPRSRRIIIDLWNSSTLHKAALPPCLCKYQFYVNTNEKKLDLMIYIRSSDYFLANNWNVATGALFVHLICNLEDIDLIPGTLTVVTGDTHLYKFHIEQAKENIRRKPRPFPKLLVKNKKKNIEDFTYEDIELIGYKPYSSIKASMAV